MEQQPSSKKLFSSKVSIVGLFAVLTLILAVPLVVLLSQERQDPRGRAAEPARMPTKTPVGQGYGYISGYVYYDQNKNGEREAEEQPFVGATVSVTQLKKNNNQAISADGKVVNTVSELKTDSLGYFKFRFANVDPNSVTYTVRLELPNGYKTINTNPVVFTNLKGGTQEVLQFGLFPLQGVTIPASPTPRSVRSGTTPQQFCAQVLTPARNSATKACNTFANSCLPAGWVKDVTCQVTPTISTPRTNSIQGD